MNNTIPVNPQDHGDDSGASPEPPKGPARLTNGSEGDECSVATQTKSIHPAAVGPISSRCRPVAESRVRYEDDEDSSYVRSSSTPSQSSYLSIHRSVKRNNSLVVSFPRLNGEELSHLRKWNRRLQRTEVFDKYYFPAKWEANEMDALVGFLKLEDPSSKIGGGMRGGSLRGSGKGKKSSHNESGVLRGRKVGCRETVSSWQGGDPTTFSDSGLTASFSSFKDSAGKLSKLLTEPKSTVDPAKITRKALNFIFFPYVHDPKSVLLKRGSVFLRDASLPNERELMIFTHGFLLANVVLEDAFSLFLALSDRDFLTEKSFLDYLQNKFREMDDEESGEVEKWELRKVFANMGIPMGESVLDELIQRSIISTTLLDQTERVDWKDLHKELQGFFAQKNDAASQSTNAKSSGSDDSGHDGNGLKKLLDRFHRRKTTKVEYASLFSNVAHVDSLDISHGDDSISRKIANSVYAQTSFSVTMNERKSEPLVFVCSKPEHRDSWVDAFKPGVVRALTKSSAKGMAELRSKLGWQHMVIRSSSYSLVILDEVEALECALQADSEEKNSYRKLRLELNLLDKHNGYSPLHYATILGHTDCMTVLLEGGSKATLKDREGLSPMYHALSLRNDEVANVLEKFGADRTDDLRKLIGHEIQAEELKQTNGGLDTHVENGTLSLDLSSSEGEENIDALLTKAASHLF